MPDHIDELIAEIAKTHHISLGRDDPILMLHLVNAHLLRESAQAQQVQLDRFKAELEETMLRWTTDITRKSERILNLSLSASSEAAAKLAQASTKSMSENLTSKIDHCSRLALRFLEQLRHLSIFNAGVACIFVFAVFLILIAS